MTSPFASVPLLLCPAPDSELLGLLIEADLLVQQYPSILQMLEEDLDAHAKNKKALRLLDARWIRRHNLSLPVLEWESQPRAEDLQLRVGRPRTSAYVVYMFLIGRGYFGGFKSSEASLLLRESVSFAVFLENQGLETMPAASTLNELANAVSNETRELILSAQVSQILSEGWDDFRVMLQDSTAVQGNTQWPTDSQLMVDLTARLLHRLAKLERFGLSRFTSARASKLLAQMKSLNKRISFDAGKPSSQRERRKLYVKLMRVANKSMALLKDPVARAQRELNGLDVLPSRRELAVRIVLWLSRDLSSLHQVLDVCRARVLDNKKVPAEDKVLSVADESAAMIVKGGREPVVGYKPQLARSAGGFVTGLIVPAGNAADSGQLMPMYRQVVARTGKIPELVSTDDGYASTASRDELKRRGVKTVSISGSKGKKITPAEEWDDPDYVAARNGRSAIESLMYTIKHGFDFGRVARRGLDNVRAELLEKVLAYNFCRMAKCRREEAESARRLAA